MLNNATNITTTTLYYWLQTHWERHGDPRVAHLPLMSSFVPFLSILTTYALFVLYFGPKLMEHRKAFSLQKTLICYNLAMCLINGYFFYSLIEDPVYTISRLLDTTYPSFTKPQTPHEAATILKCYLYLLSKLVDLLDTVFFVLRKKHSQITLLHVYHHISVPFFGYIYFRLNAICSVLVPFAFMNTFLHVLMYGYYGLAALGPQMAPYLWWKRYLTQLQIVQFAVLFVHGIFFLSQQQGYAPFFVGNYILQASIYLVLFSRFYFQTYNNNKKRQKMLMNEADENNNNNKMKAN